MIGRVCLVVPTFSLEEVGLDVSVHMTFGVAIGRWYSG